MNNIKNKIANFEKVSFEQFKKSYYNLGYKWKSDKELIQIYNDIKIPVRKTKDSAGHDISLPFDITIIPNGRIIIPTGIKCNMEQNWVMFIFPRSSLGIKKNMFISNTIPVIDSDYYFADNEGHILLSIENKGMTDLIINKGDNICQAVFVEYGIADIEEVITKRTGGIGSTDKE